LNANISHDVYDIDSYHGSDLSEVWRDYSYSYRITQSVYHISNL